MLLEGLSGRCRTEDLRARSIPSGSLIISNNLERKTAVVQVRSDASRGTYSMNNK